MERSIRATNRAQRRTFADLTDGMNWQIKADGRRFAYYWEGDSKHYIYRYQWRWRMVYGDIPQGHVIHHKNGDQTDDRIENLECILVSDHNKVHLPANMPKMTRGRGVEPIDEVDRICEQCGGTFDIRTRVKSNRFCSLECYHESMKHWQEWTCQECGATFRAPLEHGRARKYCTRACWTRARRSTTSK